MFLQKCKKNRFSFFTYINSLFVIFIVLLITVETYSAQTTLAWDTNSENDLAGYTLHYGIATASYDNSIDVKNVISYTVTNLVENETYFFAVTAYDTSSNESDYSLEVSYTVPDTTPPTDTTPPSVPNSLTANAISDTQIDISWVSSIDDVAVAGYKIFKNGIEIAVTGNTSYQDTGLTPSTTYLYSVSAFDATGNESIKSLESSATTQSPPNNPPVLDPIGNKLIDEGTLLSFTVSATDIDGDTLTFTENNTPPGAIFDESSLTFSWTPTYTQAGTYTMTCTVDDGKESDSETISIVVNNVNQPPILDPMDNIIVNEGNTVVLTPTANDPDGDSLSFTYSGWMTSNTKTTTFDDAGVHSVTVTVSDGSESDSKTISITVNNVNRPPVLDTIADITVDEGDTIVLNPTATDPDGDTLSFTYSGWMTSNTKSTTFDDEGVHSVTVTVSDGSESDSKTISITVNNVNRPPVLDTIADITVDEGDTIVLNPTATDPDGDTLSFTYSGWMTSNIKTTTFDDAGVYSVTVTVSDSSESDSKTISITVNDTNSPPILDTIADITVDEGDTVVINPTATDPDGDSLSFTYSGWMTSNTKTTGFDDAGVHSVTVNVSDGSSSDSKTISVTVNNVNRPPVLDPIADITVDEGDTVVLSPTANDPDGDTLSFTYSGWMTTDSKTTNYDDAGIYTVTITVSDGSLTDSQDITVTVNDIDPGLVISNLSVSSEKLYQIITDGLKKDALVYIDKKNKFTNIPTSILGTTYIKTANSDKGKKGDLFLSFDVNQNVTVYLAHDDHITPKPSWMASFVDSGENLVTTDTTLSLYKKDFLSGTVALGGNDGKGKSNMYSVIITSQIAGTALDVNSPSTPTNLQGIVVSPTQIDLSWDASNDDAGVAGYKIYRDGIEIDISTTPEYSDIDLSEATTYTYSVTAFDASGNESIESNLISISTLSDDNIPPTITSVTMNGLPTEVTVVYSEPVETLSATNVSNYFIDNGISILSASISEDLITVTLSTTQHSEGVLYTLQIINIEDLATIPNVIDLSTSVTYSYVGQLNINNMTVSSGKSYEIVNNGLQNGATVYIDRTFTFTDMPQNLENATYIKTSNYDKESIDDPFLSFNVDEEVTVYIAHDDRISTKPSWMSEFTDTQNDIITSDATFSLFSSDYLAGNVILGGNEGLSKSSMYIVIITSK